MNTLRLLLFVGAWSLAAGPRLSAADEVDIFPDELKGTWRSGERELTVSFGEQGCCSREAVQIATSRSDWKLERYLPRARVWVFTRTPSVDEIPAVSDGKVVPVWAKAEAVSEKRDRPLRWRLELRAQRDRSEKCHPTLHVKLFLGHFAWDESKRIVTSVTDGEPLQLIYKRPKYALPPLDGWVQPQWIDIGEARSVLGFAGESYVRSAIIEHCLSRGSLKLFGNLYAEMFKWVTIGYSVTGVVAAEELVGTIFQNAVESAIDAALRGETETWGEMGEKIFIDTLVATVAGKAAGHFVEWMGRAPSHPPVFPTEMFSNAFEEFGEWFAGLVVDKASDKVTKKFIEYTTGRQCRYDAQDFSVAYLSKNISGTVLVDKLQGEATFQFFIPAIDTAKVKHPAAIMIGTLDGLTENGAPQGFPHTMWLRVLPIPDSPRPEEPSPARSDPPVPCSELRDLVQQYTRDVARSEEFVREGSTRVEEAKRTVEESGQRLAAFTKERDQLRAALERETEQNKRLELAGKLAHANDRVAGAGDRRARAQVALSDATRSLRRLSEVLKYREDALRKAQQDYDACAAKSGGR